MSNIRPKPVVILHALLLDMDIPLDRNILRLDENKNLCTIGDKYLQGKGKMLLPVDWTVGQFIRYCNTLNDEQFGILCATFALNRL